MGHPVPDIPALTHHPASRGAIPALLHDSAAASSTSATRRLGKGRLPVRAATACSSRTSSTLWPVHSRRPVDHRTCANGTPRLLAGWVTFTLTALPVTAWLAAGVRTYALALTLWARGLLSALMAAVAPAPQPAASSNDKAVLIMQGAAARTSTAVLTGCRGAERAGRAILATGTVGVPGLAAGVRFAESCCAHIADGHGQCCTLLLLSHALRPVALLGHQLLTALRHKLLLL
jgi:hypothetical protein